jgi:thiamine-phosphate pyrophosphorylase
VTVCLVTDRRRLCGSEAASFDAARRRLGAQLRSAIAAGVDLIQVRERDLEARDLAILVTDAVGLAQGTATRVVVNERLDVALVCGADGVHLRSDSMAVADVRRIAPPGFLVGRSVHAVDEARAAVGLDYVIAGTVFETAAKPHDHPLIGIDGLRAIVSAAAVPVLAIGGVSWERLDAIARTGAAGVASVGLFAEGSPMAPLVEGVRRRFEGLKLNNMGTASLQ